MSSSESDISSRGSVLGGGGGASNNQIITKSITKSYREKFHQNGLVDHHRLHQMKWLQILVRHLHQRHH